VEIIQSGDFDSYWKKYAASRTDDAQTESTVKEIIQAVRREGDAAVMRYCARFEKYPVTEFELPLSDAVQAVSALRSREPELAQAMELAAEHIKRFSLKQKAQCTDFEYEMDDGLITGQRVIPVEKAAIYVPAGRFPLFSTVLMGLIPAFCAGVREVILASPPMEDGRPHKSVLAAAAIAAEIRGQSRIPVPRSLSSSLRIFSLGGAQAIAALALGTETIPRVDMIAGPGNKYVAMAKRLLSGEVGIDFIAGPTDVLIICGGPEVGNSTANAGAAADPAELAAADMIAQAEHDPDARARCLVPDMELARRIAASLQRKLADLSTAASARASLESGGLIIVYKNREEAIRIANAIAPEHLELQVTDAESWLPDLKNFGSLFIGSLSAEVLGDYSAGINHTLPTSGSARFTGGLSVRNFLKTVTTLRCAPGKGYDTALAAAEILASAEGLAGHARGAAMRRG